MFISGYVVTLILYILIKIDKPKRDVSFVFIINHFLVVNIQIGDY